MKFPRSAKIASRLASGGLALALLLGASPAPAQTTIYVARHADRGAAEPDPPLTAKGQRRAEALATLLADTKITHIYTTDFIRTQQTAAPLARLTEVTPVVVAQKDFDGLIARVRATARPGESTLVVGHRATVPRIVRALAGREIPPLGSAEYSRLIVITLFADGRSSVVTLRVNLD